MTAQPPDPATAQPPARLLRRCLVIGSLVGNAVFLAGGALVGVIYGGFGGVRFFTELAPIQQADRLAGMLGIITGTILGLWCVWATIVVVFTALGALAYWLRYRSYPLAVDEN